MRSEMEIMKIRISNLKNKYEAIDQSMNSETDKRFTDDSMKIMLKDQWKKDCMNEENISEDIWKQKEEWLLKQELEAEEIHANKNHFSRIAPKRPNYQGHSNKSYHQNANYRKRRPQYNNRNDFQRGQRFRRQNSGGYSPRFLEDNAQRQLGHNTDCHVNDHHRSENYRSEETRNKNRNPRYEEINENTEEENHPSLPRTFSDSFLPRGRPPTWGY